MASAKSKDDKADDTDGANDKDDEKWDVMNPPGESREIDINVTEGTWMSLDVSPDGKTIAFDMLGDIYTMPREMQPRFSPDGSRIAFTSDRAGGDNIWTMDVDGQNKEQVTKESFRLLNNPTWSPDGQFIAARKHFRRVSISQHRARSHNIALARCRRNLALSHKRRLGRTACQKAVR